MYLPKALFVLFIMTIALIGRPLFYIAMAVEDAVKGNGLKGFVLLPVLLIIAIPAVLYASLGLLLNSDLGSFSVRDISEELFTGMN